jgi:hypothetical protein
MSRAITSKVGRVAREAANGWNDHHVAVSEGGHQFSKLRPVGVGAGELFAELLLTPGGLQLGELAGKVLRLGRRGHSRKSCAHSASEICIKKASRSAAWV